MLFIHFTLPSFFLSAQEKDKLHNCTTIRCIGMRITTPKRIFHCVYVDTNKLSFCFECSFYLAFFFMLFLLRPFDFSHRHQIFGLFCLSVSSSCLSYVDFEPPFVIFYLLSSSFLSFIFLFVYLFVCLFVFFVHEVS
jgi:hypothetical protein